MQGNKQILVVYRWYKSEKSGFGNTDFTIYGDININSIRDMEKQICEKFKYDFAVLLNIIELGTKDTLSP